MLSLVLTWEKWLTEQHFGENAARGPHIDRRGVLGPACHDLGRSVPPRSDIVCEDGALRDSWLFG